jgi:hypothetical protein
MWVVEVSRMLLPGLTKSFHFLRQALLPSLNTFNVPRQNIKCIYEISDYHGGDFKDYRLMGCNAMQPGRNITRFRRNVHPPPLGEQWSKLGAVHHSKIPVIFIPDFTTSHIRANGILTGSIWYLAEVRHTCFRVSLQSCIPDQQVKQNYTGVI